MPIRRRSLLAGLACSTVSRPAVADCVSARVSDPVLFGVTELGPADGAPFTMTVFYPALPGLVRLNGGTSKNVFASCPHAASLIVLIHGDGTTWQSWTHLPASLARAGYIVAVPEVPHAPMSDAVDKTVSFVSQRAPFAAALDGRVGLIGHSLGAGAVMQFATDPTLNRNVGGIAALSANYEPVFPGGPPFGQLRCPVMIVWGREDALIASGDSPSYDLTQPGNVSSNWAPIPAPKHLLTIERGHHYDYVGAGAPGLMLQGDTIGPCREVPFVIAAWLTTFFAHAIPRPQPDPIDDQLLPAAISPPFGACFLTDLIDFKAGQIAHPSDTCGFSHYWETQTTGNEDLVVPNWSVGIQYVTNGTHQSGSKTVTCQIVATASGLWHPRFTWSLGWPGASVKPLSADGAMVSITFPNATVKPGTLLGALTLTASDSCGRSVSLHDAILPTYAALGLAPPSTTTCPKLVPGQINAPCPPKGAP